MKIGKVALGLLGAVGVAALVVGVSVGSARTTKKAAAFKAAWIYVGPHNDNGWSQAHDRGRLYVQQALGSKVQTTYKENVPEGRLIETTELVCARPLPTMNISDAALFRAIYLAGMAAGAASKKGVIGYVVPFAIPEVIRHTNAFALGAQATHPGAKVKIIWTNSWLDVGKEKKAAQNLVAAGADVLGQNVDSPATGQYAESKGVPWAGYDSNAQKFAPKQWLTAAVYNWGPYYLRKVKAAMNGTWKTNFYYGSLKDGLVGLAPYGKKVSAKTKKAIAKKKSALIKGSFYEFTGPLYDQKGKLRVPKGKRLTVKDLYAMNWLVRGVIGSAKG